MQYFVALLIAAAAAWFISTIGSGAFAALIGGYRPEGWPRGVQEEDRDRPWGTPAPATHVSSVLALMDNAHAVATSRLHGRTRAR